MITEEGPKQLKQKNKRKVRKDQINVRSVSLSTIPSLVFLDLHSKPRPSGPLTSHPPATHSTPTQKATTPRPSSTSHSSNHKQRQASLSPESPVISVDDAVTLSDDPSKASAPPRPGERERAHSLAVQPVHFVKSPRQKRKSRPKLKAPEKEVRLTPTTKKNQRYSDSRVQWNSSPMINSPVAIQNAKAPGSEKTRRPAKRQHTTDFQPSLRRTRSKSLTNLCTLYFKDETTSPNSVTLSQLVISLTETNSEDSGYRTWVNPEGSPIVIEKFSILLTYRLFCSPTELFNTLKQRASDDSVVLQVLNIIKHWVTEFPMDFLFDFPLRIACQNLLKHYSSLKHREVASLARKIINQFPKEKNEINAKMLQDIDICAEYPQSIARILTSTEILLWNKINPTQSWNEKELLGIRHWNRMLQTWVKYKILRGVTITERFEVMLQFLYAAEELLQQHWCTNFNTFLGIIEALSQFRKCILFKGLPIEIIQRYESLSDKYFVPNWTTLIDELKRRTETTTPEPFVPPLCIYSMQAERYSSKVEINNIKQIKEINLSQISSAIPYFSAVYLLHKTHPNNFVALDLENSDVQFEHQQISEMNMEPYLVAQLQEGIRRNDKFAVKLILKHKPNLRNYVDPSKQTPLHWVAMYDSSSICELLLLYDKTVILDVWAINAENESPIHIAFSRGHSNILSLLLSYHELFSKKSMIIEKEILDSFLQYKAQFFNSEDHQKVTQVWEVWLKSLSKGLNTIYPVITSTKLDKNTLPWTSFKKNSFISLDPQLLNKSKNSVRGSTILAQLLGKIIFLEKDQLRNLVFILTVVKSHFKDNNVYTNEAKELFQSAKTVYYWLKKHVDSLYQIHEDNIDELTQTMEKVLYCKSVYENYAATFLKMKNSIKKEIKSKKYMIDYEGESTPCNVFLQIPILRFKTLSTLFTRYSGFFEPESLQKISQLESHINELLDAMENLLLRNKAEKMYQNISSTDKSRIESHGTIVACGKLHGKKKLHFFILFADVLLGFSQNFRGTYALEGEYEMQQITDTSPSDQYAFYIHFSTSDSICLTAKDAPARNMWLQKIHKAKKLWKSQFCKNDIATEMANGINQENLKKFWRIHSSSDPTPWIDLGDLYRFQENYLESKRCYTNALSLIPKTPNFSHEYKVLYKIAKIHGKLGEVFQQLECLRKAKSLLESSETTDFVTIYKITALISKLQNSSH